MSEQEPSPRNVNVGVVTVGGHNYPVKKSDAVIQYERCYEIYDHILILPEDESQEPVRYFPEDHQEICDQWIPRDLRQVASCEPDEATRQAYSEQVLTPEGIEVSVESMMNGLGDFLNRP